jgi:hypothetical protein
MRKALRSDLGTGRDLWNRAGGREFWILCSYVIQNSRHVSVNTVSKQSLYSSCIFFSSRKAPSVPGPPLYRGLTITLTDTPQSIGLMWKSKLPTQTPTWQKTKSQQRGILFLSLIQTLNYSKRATADARLRQSGYWDRLSTYSRFIYLFGSFYDAVRRLYDVDVKMTVEWRTTEYLEKSLVNQSRFKANAFCQLQGNPLFGGP